MSIYILGAPDPSRFSQMPTLTMSDARSLIAHNLFTRKEELLLIRQINNAEELTCLEGSEFYKDLLATVNEFKVASVGTVGKPMTGLIVGDLTGRVLAINNISTTGVALSLQLVLENRQIRWIQSAIEEVRQFLEDYVVWMKTWVDSDLIYRACVRDEEDNRFGREAQAEYLGQEEFPYLKRSDSKETVYTCKCVKKEREKIEKCRVAQEVRVPLALVLQTTVNYMKEYGYAESANITPFLNNLLHAFTNVPHISKFVWKRFKHGEKPWLPKPKAKTLYVEGTTLVNNLFQIAVYRRALEHYSTDLSTPMFKEPPLLFHGDRRKQAEKNWEGLELPNRGTDIVWSRFCITCGSRHLKECPDRQLAKCQYPLCNSPDVSHTTKVCQALHRWCYECGMTGHFVDAHKHFCHEVLQRVFLKWAPFGLYTSLVYLDPNNDHYWTFFLHGVQVVDNKLAKEAQIVLLGQMELTKSIAKYWAVGRLPPEDCLLQMTEEPTPKFLGYLQQRVCLSDGVNQSSLFIYRPQGISKILPGKFAVLRVKCCSFRLLGGYCFVNFDDFEVVAESCDQLIGNPRHLERDPQSWKSWTVFE